MMMMMMMMMTSDVVLMARPWPRCTSMSTFYGLDLGLESPGLDLGFELHQQFFGISLKLKARQLLLK